MKENKQDIPISKEVKQIAERLNIDDVQGFIRYFNDVKRRQLSEQEVHMREMFEKCGYSYEEVVEMMRRGEMVGRSFVNTYGFTDPDSVTSYEFHIGDEHICSFYMGQKLVQCANSKAGYGISMEVIRTYDYKIYKTREEIDNGK